jgi:Histidine kinase-, DNA gyrase B-, and HSP90-like ATPase
LFSTRGSKESQSLQVGPETCLMARLAIYRDGEPEPKVEEVQGTGPEELIHRLCTATERVIRDEGAILPQPAIRALIENLVHACFQSPTVSVLDGGRTIRVADRGPGIVDKQRAVEPGYSSAGEAERRIIAGVGAGLAIAARQAEEGGGRLEISDNLGGGTVVTLTFAGTGNDVRSSLARPLPTGLRRSYPAADGPSELSDNGKRVLLLLAELGGSGLTTICDELRIPAGAARSELDSLRRLGLLDPADQAHLVLTSAGLSYLDGIFVE